MYNKKTSRSLKDCNILIVDDQTSSRLIMTTLLEPLFICHTMDSATKAIEFCRETPPDLVLMDVYMPDMDGHEACILLANDPLTEDIPVVFVTASISDEEQEKCWNAGGADFVQKPINATTLINRVKFHVTHKLKTDLLEQLIYTDRLTGCYNRHYLEEHLPQMIRDADREGQALSVAIFDADLFKQFNDRYGHIKGDSCLWKIAKSLNESLLRPRDKLIRVGGEEFLILLPQTDESGAQTVCERILHTISQQYIEHSASPTGYLTVSAGAATYHPGTETDIDKVMVDADKCLYHAKDNGRNSYAFIDDSGDMLIGAG